MQEIKKPLPALNEDSTHFWEAVNRHEFLIQRCKICGGYPPTLSPFGGGGCPEHGDVQMEWVPASGKGTVFTFVVFHRPFHPAVQTEVPYNVAMIELAEGPLTMSNVVECSNEEIKIGMSVEVVFDDVTETDAVIKFKPAA
jgi:uncharacterized protein